MFANNLEDCWINQEGWNLRKLSEHAISCCYVECTHVVSATASFWDLINNIIQENTIVDILVEDQLPPPLVTVDQECKPGVQTLPTI